MSGQWENDIEATDQPMACVLTRRDACLSEGSLEEDTRKFKALDLVEIDCSVCVEGLGERAVARRVVALWPTGAKLSLCAHFCQVGLVYPAC